MSTCGPIWNIAESTGCGEFKSQSTLVESDTKEQKISACLDDPITNQTNLSVLYRLQIESEIKKTGMRNYTSRLWTSDCGVSHWPMVRHYVLTILVTKPKVDLSLARIAELQSTALDWYPSTSAHNTRMMCAWLFLPDVWEGS